MLHLLVPGIHAHFKNSLQAYTLKSLTLAQEEFLLSLEYFSVALLFYLGAVLIGFIERQEDMLKPFLLYLRKMELPSFSPGRPRQETKQQKKERLRKQRLQKQKEQDRKARKQGGFIPLPKKPNWLLLPSHRCQGFEFWLLTLEGSSYFTKRADLLKQMDRARKPTKPAFGFPDPSPEGRIMEFLIKANKVMELLYENQVLRWKLKKFFTNWRIQKFHRINITDPITLEPFNQPIQFPSFQQRKIYTFEAESFLKHCHKKLLLNDGQIPTPQVPKNPLTNEDFSLCQIMGLVSQCRELCKTSWAVEAFVSCDYDMTTFVAVHSKPLRLQAIRTTMANISSWDAIDILYDFIQSEHAYHKKPFTPTTYKWAVERVPKHQKIQAWRKMCLKWYETDIVIDDYDTKQRYFQIISGKTEVLCGLPHELQVVRKLYLKSKHQSEAESNGSSSTRDTESEG